MAEKELILRYGCNPHQTPARAYAKSDALPFEVLSGSPGYINLMDALNSWQLVKELRQVLDLPAAASFKHVSPAGAAVYAPLSDALKQAYFVDDMDLSPLGVAYARARGADRLSSFGDWAALSDTVDVKTARLLSRETTDGVVAPDYEPEALEILKKKRGGSYQVLKMDPNYEPAETEAKEIYGVVLEQKRNNHVTGPEILENVITKKKEIPPERARDLLVATIALKYTQSNSICFAADGQVIGAGAGQQNRLACTDLAARKAEAWYLRQHPGVLAFRFKPELKRPDRINAIELYLRGDMTSFERQAWETAFVEVPAPLTDAERREWLSGLDNVSLSSDAFIPFRDNIDRASRTGVKYIVQAGGSIRDDDVAAAADEYDMVMALSGIRLFHH
ncbi:MAG: phosphoribosylaminoimidazolecarboxamide formyltransferase [Gemmatimonadetes bacterium]|jgi:phosphoribosylaminoimidazolecarboxamide formyltransferase / IMP cyclohydrolase|nr:phosphoribosylaminoimidazolecarboxamide formyltransferase [Gemmatimonadota bacterium]